MMKNHFWEENLFYPDVTFTVTRTKKSSSGSPKFIKKTNL